MAKNKKKNDKTIQRDSFENPLCYLMAICPFLIGLAYEYLILFATCVVLIVLLICVLKRRKITIYASVGSVAGLLMLIFSGVSVFTGLIPGESVFGFLRVLCASIWVLLLMQLSTEEKDQALGVIPEVAAVMTVVSALMYTMGSVANFVFNNGRMSGFFQYANTFALYLLVAFVIRTNQNCKHTAKDKKEKVKQYLYPMIYLIGILWSGSRTTFFMTAAVILITIIRKKQVRKYYSLLTLAGIVGVVVYVAVTGRMESIGRFLTTSITSSTLVGRVLYWQDAIRMLLSHPQGIGYMGFYFLQGKEQTGVYSVQFVHNEWLQMALDFGVLFLVAFVVLFVYQFKHIDGEKRSILLLIGVHMAMDFDLQFMSILWVLLLSMDWQLGKKMIWDMETKKASKPLIWTFCFLFWGVSGWLGLGNALYQQGSFDASVAIYPWSLRAQEQYMLASSTAEEYEVRAKKVLSLYEDDAPALDIMALCEAEKGDYISVEQYKKHSLQVQKYRTECYDDYIMMMDTGAQQYKEMGDEAACEKCVKSLLEIPELLEEVEQNTNPLAYKINDKPNFTLSEKSRSILDKWRQCQYNF